MAVTKQGMHLNNFTIYVTCTLFSRQKIKIQTPQASNDNLYIKKHNTQNTAALKNTQ
jgi:hypothetical protein